MSASSAWLLAELPETNRALAAGARDAEELARTCRQCTACPELAAHRTSVVPGDVVPGARVIVVGEAPGAQEDAEGRPFVGRSGQVLDGLLRDAGLPRGTVSVLNTVKCRPPANRLPTREETARCRGWLEHQLALCRPELVVALGLSATRWFLGRTALAPVRGRVHDVSLRSPAGAAVGAVSLRVLPTWHPSGALRSGPGGQPMAQLRADLQLAATLVAPGRAAP